MRKFTDFKVIFRIPESQITEHDAQIADAQIADDIKGIYKNRRGVCKIAFCLCHHPLTKKLNEQKEYRSALNGEIEIAQLNTQIDKLIAKIAELDAQIAEHVSRIAEFLNSIFNLNNKINQQKEQIDTLIIRIHQQNDEIDNLNARIANQTSIADEKNQRLERCMHYSSEEIDKLHNIVHSLIAVSSIFLGIIVYLSYK